MNETINHYDSLIDENNDPVNDPVSLREYMDKWDGLAFIDELQVTAGKSILEIGVGSGRIAVKVCGLCKTFTGIDISPKTIERAKVNLKAFENTTLICGDFTTYKFAGKFDIIYSSLTFMHIRDKQTAIAKTAGLLNKNGRFVLSVDKNDSQVMRYGARTVKIYPDTVENITDSIDKAGLKIIKRSETEFAHIFTAVKRNE